MKSEVNPQGMRLIIGLDEAGYGPNLGPLVIGGSAWLAPKDYSEADFCKAFDGIFSPAAWTRACQHIPLGDSKKLYQSGGGLITLEVGVLSLLEMFNRPPRNLEALVELLGDNIKPSASAPAPWYTNLSTIEVPHDSTVGSQTLINLAKRATDALNSQKIRLLAMKAVVITESEFNRQINQLGSKGSVLSQATFQLAARLLEITPELPATVFFDRQGGRKNYLPLLLEWMPDRWFIEILHSSRRCSYRAQGQPDLTIHFTVGGDSFPATALASMVAKYLRERFMESFNNFWNLQVPNIRPTAGYPADAKRFRNEILPTANKIALEVDDWWRCR